MQYDFQINAVISVKKSGGTPLICNSIQTDKQ